MGSPADESDRGLTDEDEVQVTLTHPFEIQQTELTRATWATFFSTEPVSYDPDPDADVADCTAANCPVDGATFSEALSTANAWSDREGLPECYALSGCVGALGAGLTCTQATAVDPSPYACGGYRLPTEAEWEYAARAGTTTIFSGGTATLVDGRGCKDVPLLDDYAWYCANSGSASHVVGAKQSNPWGIFDMEGNVLEWTDGAFTPDGYGAGPLTDPYFLPTPGSEWASFRVIRGGDAVGDAATLRNASRLYLDITLKIDGVGFRLARTLSP